MSETNQLLFTHDDLDGAACELVFLLRKYFSCLSHDFKIIRCSNNNVDQMVQHALDDGTINSYSTIYFTDIAPSKKLVIELNDKLGNNLIIIDHHKTNLYINDIVKNSYVVTEIQPGKMACGASLLLDHFYGRRIDHDSYFKENFVRESISFMRDFVEMVRLYDTYEWKKDNDERPYRLNVFFKMLGPDIFIQHYTSKIDNARKFYLAQTAEILPLHVLSYDETRFIDAVIERQQNIIDSITLDDVQVIDIKGVKAAIMLAPLGANVNEIANQFLSKYKEVDIFIEADIKRGVWSFRSLYPKFDVSSYAKQMGGGGHPCAAGAPMDYNLKDGIVSTLINHIQYNLTKLIEEKQK